MRYAFALILLAVFCGCRQGYTAKQEENAKAICVGLPFVNKGKGTPAEFATNQRGQLNREGAIVRGDLSGDYAEAVRRLSQCKEDADLGFAWKAPRTQIEIPEMSQAPVIDGKLAPGEWNRAYRLNGEYVLNSETPTAASKSEWYIGWHNGTLYVAGRFNEKDLQIFNGTIDSPETGKDMFHGDSLEFFLRPQEQNSTYYEVIVNPAGKLWGLFHLNNPWGGIFTIDPRLKIGRAAATNT